MSYDTALNRVVDDLVLLVADDELPDRDVAGARLAQQQTLVTLAGVYADLVATRVTTRTPDRGRLAEHPAAALREHLDRPYPTFPNRPSPEPVSAAGHGWNHLRGQATVAAYEWSTADPESRPTGDQRWTAVADLAAIFEAISVLRPDPDPALGLTAREVRRLASLGPLPQPGRLVPLVTKPVRVRRQIDLAPALQRLSQLLGRTDHIDPAGVAQIAQLVALTCAALATSLTRAEVDPRTAYSPALPHGLRALERAIRPPAHTTRGLATALGAFTDPRPGAQAREIWRALNGGGIGSHGTIPYPEPVALLHASRMLQPVTTALLDTAVRQFDLRRWLVPSHADELRWVTPTAAAEPPGILRVLHRAVVAAAPLQLEQWAGIAAGARDSLGVGTLAAQLDQTRVRPADPGSRTAVHV